MSSGFEYNNLKVPDLHLNASKYFMLNSSFRTEGTNNYFTCQLNDTIKNIKCMQLDYVEFANNIIPTQNKNIEFREDSYTNPVVLALDFGDIFYTPNDMATYLQNELNLWSPGGYTYTVAIDSSNYFTFDCAGGTFCMTGILLVNLGWVDVITVDYFYPEPVPDNFTPLVTYLRAPQPLMFRYNAVAIAINPFSSDTILNGRHYIRPTSFIVPLTTNYGEMQYFNIGSQFPQKILYGTPGQNFRTLAVRITPLFTIGGQYDLRFDINATVILRCSYTSYNDPPIYYNERPGYLLH